MAVVNGSASGLKEYTFEYYSEDQFPGWDEYSYYTGDISLNKQPLFSERSCLIAVGKEEGLISEELVGIMTTYDIERILIENGIYVKFVEG